MIAIQNYFVKCCICAVIFTFLNPALANDDDFPPGDHPKKINEIANLIAGTKISSQSEFKQFANSNFYKNYKRYIQNKLKSFLIPNNKNLNKWGKKNLPQFCENEKQTVFYPFSGPDITNALSLFPNSKYYILFGLEPPGNIPDIYNYSHEQLSHDLESLRESLFMMLNLNFFETRGMKRQLNSKSLANVASIILFFVRLHGYTDIKIRTIAISRDAKIIPRKSTSVINPFYPPRPFHIPGIEFIIKKSGSDAKTIQYFSLNIDDKYLEKYSLHFLNYLGAFRSLMTLIKSASYILHHDVGRFTIIRSYILANSKFIVQDDTGVPLKYFSSNLWDLNFYGVYHKPVKVFKDMFQADLKKMFNKKSKRHLPFIFGYGKNSLKGSNILTASKKQTNNNCEKN